jgi:F-type H+-transporting ATPase subunit delta
MTNSSKEYAEALKMALEESKPEDADVIIENFVALLKTNDQLDMYEAIVEQYEAMAKDEASVTQVEAVFAREASSNKQLVSELNKIVGPRLEVRSKVDDSLVGGMVLRVDDTLIDASVQNSLRRMEKDLTE